MAHPPAPSRTRSKWRAAPSAAALPAAVRPLPPWPQPSAADSSAVVGAALADCANLLSEAATRAERCVWSGLLGPRDGDGKLLALDGFHVRIGDTSDTRLLIDGIPYLNQMDIRVGSRLVPALTATEIAGADPDGLARGVLTGLRGILEPVRRRTAQGGWRPFAGQHIARADTTGCVIHPHAPTLGLSAAAVRIQPSGQSPPKPTALDRALALIAPRLAVDTVFWPCRPASGPPLSAHETLEALLLQDGLSLADQAALVAAGPIVLVRRGPAAAILALGRPSHLRTSACLRLP